MAEGRDVAATENAVASAQARRPSRIAARTAHYSANVISNLEFLGDRARELTDQEVDRARILDTKASWIIAGCVALIGGAAAFASRLGEVSGGTGAHTLWAVELGIAVLALLVAGALAVWAIAPRVVRTTVAYSEAKRWATSRALESDPAFQRGKLLRASLHSVGSSRPVNKKKADHLAWSFAVFAVALVALVSLAISMAIHAAAF